MIKLPSTFCHQTEWTFVGPMGPALPTSFLTHCLLAVDGGAHFSPRIDVWVGDSDSYLGAVECEHIFKFSEDKAASDLSLALSLFKDSHCHTFHFWGFLGGRRDHELFNLGESLTFLASHPHAQISFYDESGFVSLKLFGAGSWNIQHQGLFSLGCLHPTKVSLKGECRYHLDDLTSLLPLSSFGLSNLATGNIHLENVGPVFLTFKEGT